MKAFAPEAGPGDKPIPPRDARVLTDGQRALVAAHMGLVGLHLKRHVPRGRAPTRHREHDDLFQEGFVALIHAAITYEVNGYGGSFAAYALPRIRAAVHVALKEHFLTIRVPLRANRLAERRNPGSVVPRPAFAEGLTAGVSRNLVAGPSVGAGEESLRHAIRERYVRALGLALVDMKERPWRQAGAIRIIERIAHERLLVCQPEAQTSLRRLARETGSYLSRVESYEGHLFRALRRHFAADPQVPLLVQFAQSDDQGFDGQLDKERRKRLDRAERLVFARRFRQLPRPAKAELIYRLIEASSVTVTEVACNLYRLTNGPAPQVPAKAA